MDIWDWLLMGFAFWVMCLVVGAVCFGSLGLPQDQDRLDEALMVGCGLLVLGLPMVEVVAGLFYLASRLVWII